MYWIDTNPDAETFTTPQAAIEDWMRDHTTLPSAVFFTLSDGRQGSIAIKTEGPEIKPFSTRYIAYALGGTTWH